MKLRNKVLISIGLTWVVFVAIIYFGSRFFLIQTFLNLEQERAELDLTRIDNTLSQLTDNLLTYTIDWSQWTELYEYMQNNNPDFVRQNISLIGFLNSKISLVSYWDNGAKLILGAAVDIDKKKYTAFPKGLEKYIYPGSPLFSIKNTNQNISGTILTSSGILLIAATPITDNDKKMPVIGISIFGQMLNQIVINKIAKVTQTHLKLFLLKDIQNSFDLTKSFNIAIKKVKAHVNIPRNSDIIDSYTVIKDINNKPIGMFQAERSRSIYQSGLKTINYYLVAIILAGLIFTCFGLILIRYLIVKRLETLDKSLTHMNPKNNITERVKVSGNDELSSVSHSINHLLDEIQNSQEKLEERVQERTQELVKSNEKLQHEINERNAIERELIIHKEHLVRLAHYDNLTSLPNRVFFNEILDKAITHSKKENKKFAIIFIDLDKFKKINDALGHPTGDQVIKEISSRFASLVRTEDILARSGGDEFLILLSNIKHAKFAAPIVESILKACAQPIKIDTHEFYLTASIGISIFPDDGDSLEDLQKNADTAMYKAKLAGGNGYQFFTKAMNIIAKEQIQLEAELRRALEHHEFTLHYQPQLDLHTGNITRIEALIRWEHPTEGLINPVKFIPLAEETGLILSIGEWVIRKACQMNIYWQQCGYEPVIISVNISPKQFRHQNIVEIIANALRESGLDPNYLEIEITESTIMEDIEIAIDRLKKISAMGVSVAIDDFGTGYTSIGYLKTFSVDIIKIDQNFIKGIPHQANDMAITNAIIALAHNLGLKVVAEGVETKLQMDYLAKHDCDLIQGYYISRPLPDSKIILQFRKKDERDALL